MVSAFHYSVEITVLHNYSFLWLLRVIICLLLIFSTILNFTALSGCTPFSIRDTFSTTLSRLTHNGMAAWRSGGFHYLCCGR
jgi:hypothetical protein